MAQRDATRPEGAPGPADLGTAGTRIGLRPVGPGDEPFLYLVYASTRADELALVDWDEAQKDAFVRMQFTAQHRYYHEQFPDAAYQIILVDGQPGGRLYVERAVDEVLIVDIALLPEYRGRGIGTHLLHALQAEAALAGKPLRIHVERFNPALRLYARLGFRMIADRGVYLFLEWAPTAQPSNAAPAASAAASPTAPAT
jgi:GNAT superfamily N-acetyltransferase